MSLDLATLEGQKLSPGLQEFRSFPLSRRKILYHFPRMYTYEVIYRVSSPEVARKLVPGDLCAPPLICCKSTNKQTIQINDYKNVSELVEKVVNKCLKRCGELKSPIGITRYSHWPYFVLNAVF